MTERNTSQEDMDDLIALYALGALDDDDRARVERRLATDAQARAVFDQMQETVGALHADISPLDPVQTSARVKERLFARVDADLASRNMLARRESPWERLKRLLLPLSTAVAAVSLVAAIVLGASVGSLQQQLGQAQLQFAQTQQQLTQAQQQLSQAEPELAQAREQLAQIQQELAQAQQQLTQARQQLSQTQQQLAQAQAELAQTQQQLAQARQELGLLQQPGLQLVSLPRAESAPASAQFNFFAAPSNATALLTVSGLQPLPSNQTYEFWLLRDGQPSPAGTFNVDANGTGKLLVQATDLLSTFDQAGITVEPAGGSATPNLDALVSIGSIR